MSAEISKRVGSNVRRFRRERDMTQARMVEALAEAGLDLSESMLSRLENGQRTVTVDQLVALADVLDVAPIELLEPPVPPSVAPERVTVVPMPAVLDPNMLRALASLAITADLQAAMTSLMASTASSTTQHALTNIARMAGANMEQVMRRNIEPLLRASQAALPKPTEGEG